MKRADYAVCVVWYLVCVALGYTYVWFAAGRLAYPVMRLMMIPAASPSLRVARLLRRMTG